MQPCAVCGGTAVSAAGYCLQCGTHRGTGYAPTSGAGYAPTSGAGYAPTSGGGYAPTSGAGYPPGSFAPPPAPTRSRSLVPLVALSSTLVVLVVAIVVVAIVRKKGGSTDSTTTNPGLVDSCVVGSWKITSYDATAVGNNGETVKYAGSGGTVRLRADGTGDEDLSGSIITTSISGHGYQFSGSGTITFDYRTANGSMAFSNVVSNATRTWKVDGVTTTTEAVAASEDPANYSCSGDSFKQFTSSYTVGLSRTSRNG